MQTPETIVPSRTGALIVTASAAVFLALLAFAAAWRPCAGLCSYQERAKPVLTPGLDPITNRNAKLLRLGLLTLNSELCAPEQLAASSTEAIALVGKAIPVPSSTQLSNTLPPSTALLPDDVTGLPEEAAVVSIVCRSDDLFNAERGIVTHPHERGRESERLAWVSAKVDNKLVLESPVGLRIHGGATRADADKSFAIVWRKDYGGEPASASGLFFGPDTPPASEIVLSNAASANRCLAALAVEIATRFGCKTSRCMPAIVYLNGTRIRTPFFLYQRQSPEFVEGRYGLHDIEWLRLKSGQWTEHKTSTHTGVPTQQDGESEDTPPAGTGVNIENAPFAALEKWLRHVPAPLSFAEASARYDLDDLCSWALAVSYLGIADNNQGAYFKDRASTEARWESLVWDFDGAFNRAFGSNAVRNAEVLGDPFAKLIGPGFRAALFHRLMAESPEFREHFSRRAQDCLTRDFTRDSLLSVVEKHASLIRRLSGVSPQAQGKIDQAKAFLSARHEWFLSYLARRNAEMGNRASTGTSTPWGKS